MVEVTNFCYSINTYMRLQLDSISFRNIDIHKLRVGDMESVIIGVDLGGTQIRAARLNRKLELLERRETLTLAHEGRDKTIQRIKDMIRQVLPDDGSLVAGIGISAPGPLNPQTGVVVAPPNLDGWHNVPLGDILQEEFQVPVFAGNDANVAALAEVARGAAQGYRHAIYITVSTGVGGGIIYDGRLLLGREGLAAEVGHMPLLVADNRVSTLEKEAAGPALARHMRKRLEAGATSSVTDAVQGDLTKINARHIGEAALAGDTLAQEVVTYGAHCVGLGVVTMLHVFNPQIVVIGGGVSNIGALFFDQVEKTVRDYVLDETYWRDMPIVPAGLAGDVSIIGAATLVITQGGLSDVTQVLALLNES
jgi:glucokinase